MGSMSGWLDSTDPYVMVQIITPILGTWNFWALRGPFTNLPVGLGYEAAEIGVPRYCSAWAVKVISLLSSLH